MTKAKQAAARPAQSAAAKARAQRYLMRQIQATAYLLRSELRRADREELYPELYPETPASSEGLSAVLSSLERLRATVEAT